MANNDTLWDMIPARHRAIALVYRTAGGNIGETARLLGVGRQSITRYREDSKKVDMPDGGSMWAWDAWRYAADAEVADESNDTRDQLIVDYHNDEARIYQQLRGILEEDIMVLAERPPNQRDADELERVTKTAVMLLSDRRKGLGVDVQRVEHSGGVTVSDQTREEADAMIASIQADARKQAEA